MYRDYQETQGIFSLVTLYGSRWLNTQLAILDEEILWFIREHIRHDEQHYAGFDIQNYKIPGRVIPFARITTSQSPEELSHVGGTVCAVAFELEVPPRIPWVTIDNIVTVVESYRPAPEPLDLVRAHYGFEEAHVYYIEIDNPEVSKINIFKAEYHFAQGKAERMGVVRLEPVKPPKPEMFVVRVNAKTPGIYSFGIYLLVRHKDLKQRIPILTSTEVMFK